MAQIPSMLRKISMGWGKSVRARVPFEVRVEVEFWTACARVHELKEGSPSKGHVADGEGLCSSDVARERLRSIYRQTADCWRRSIVAASQIKQGVQRCCRDPAYSGP